MTFDVKKRALHFVVLLGVVSLLADLTYEGARSITGPFLALLGATGTAVGVAAGLGELVGYAFRLVAGYFADRTRQYWTFTIVGYAVNLLAVPLLALAGSWEVAAGLMVMERLGKAIRKPARDVMLSHATSRLGRGWGFGLHEALDQIGAVAGPILMATILAFRDSYRLGFAVLLIPALLALALLIVARTRYPRPESFERSAFEGIDTRRWPRGLWLYLCAIAFIALGFADFPLIAFHLKRTAVLSDTWIPILYALAMGVDALAALAFGRWFDRGGFRALVGAVVASFLFAPFVFFGELVPVIIGMCLWGIGMGAQESILRAALADIVPADRRGTAYGLFHAGFGLAWFAGSATMGILYDVSITALVIFSVMTQATAIPVLWVLTKRQT